MEIQENKPPPPKKKQKKGTKKHRIAKTILNYNNKRTAGDTATTDFKLYYIATDIKTAYIGIKIDMLITRIELKIWA